MPAAPAPFPARIPKLFRKTITFDGTAGNGAVGTVAIASVIGAVLIREGAIRCVADLIGGATIELGCAGATAAIVAQTTATDIDANEFWQDSSPELRASPAITARAVGGNIILTIGSANITAGVLEFYFYWLPLSSDGQMA